MRSRLVILFILLIACLSGVVVNSVWLNITSLTIVLAIGAMMLIFSIIKLWKSILTGLVSKSRKALNKSPENTNSLLDQISELDANQELIAQKFQVSAELISNLSQPEKIDTISDVIKDDPIGQALSHIKGEMQKLKEEDARQGWITQGLAQFSTILRTKTDIKEYGHNIISNLVRYLGANQGGLFIEYSNEGSERFMELVACYAYGKRKFTDAKEEPGIGLLGQCMLEKDFIFITDVPKNYVKITSGLGEATPRNIVIAPLINNEIFCGAIEIASFEILQPHHIEFLKKVCEDIASEIAALKTVEHTRTLLEESNVLTQELQAREEEMRQNLEELAATQEEMSRKQIELSGVINAIDSTLGTAELDINGSFSKQNSIFEEILGYDDTQLRTKDFRLICGDSQIAWSQILQGDVKSGDYKTRSKGGLDVWLSVTFTVIHDTAGNASKVLSLIQDVTQRKIKEREFERLSLVANNTDNAVLVTDKFGITEYVNDGFSKMTGYQPHEIIGKKPGHVLQGEDTNPETVKRISQLLKLRQPIYEEILNYDKSGKPYWVSVAINPVFNKAGEVEQFISIQANITETKNASLDYRYKLEAIGRSNAIVEFDTQGFILDANENFLKLTGYTIEELAGNHHRIFLHPGEAELPSYAEFWKRLGQGEFISDEFSRVTKSGSTIWLKGIYNPIFDMHGKPKKIVKFAVDITEEKRLEIFASRKQRELNSYLEGINNTIASAEFSPEGKFISANEIFFKIMNYKMEEIEGNNFDFFMGEDQTVVMMWENLRLGKFFSGEFKMRNSEGKELWLTGTFNPIKVDRETPDKIMMFAQFTTQEKEKLNDLNTMVQALKSTLPVMELNPNFSCKTANEKALKFFGVTRMDLRSKKMNDFIAPYYQTTWNNRSDEIIRTNFSVFTLPLNSPSGIIHYEVSSSVVHNLDGSIAKIVLILVKETENITVMAAV